MRHWAHELIGRPYSAEFRCWDLVRLVFATRFGVAMPEHAAGVLNLRAAAEASGWRPVDTIGLADDIVLMRNVCDERHVGVLIEADGRIGVLHNDGHVDAAGRTRGCVAFDTLHALATSGYGKFEFWRCTQCLA